MFDYSEFETQTNSGQSNIHPSAMIAKGAQLDSSVVVGPNAMIGPKVKLGKGVKLGAGAIVTGNTEVGEGLESILTRQSALTRRT